MTVPGLNGPRPVIRRYWLVINGTSTKILAANLKINKIETVLVDRGSKYAVAGAPAVNKAEAQAVIRALCVKKKYAKATHNTWALIQQDGTQIKADDGESGAGAIVLRILQEKQCFEHIVIVTRWYGGVHLGGDRFRHVKTCVQTYLDTFIAE